MKGILQINLDDVSVMKLAMMSTHEKIICHHVTLIFGVKDDSDVVVHNVGKTVNFKGIKVCDSELAQAIVCDSFDIDILGNRTPHVTISTEVGVKPMVSNGIIKNPTTSYVVDIDLSGEFVFANL